ncbi:tyrosine--tRNA ligase 1, cytoplasmic-like protein [Tanacetum coccineum]
MAEEELKKTLYGNVEMGTSDFRQGELIISLPSLIWRRYKTIVMNIPDMDKVTWMKMEEESIKFDFHMKKDGVKHQFTGFTPDDLPSLVDLLNTQGISTHEELRVVTGQISASLIQITENTLILKVNPVNTLYETPLTDVIDIETMGKNVQLSFHIDDTFGATQCKNGNVVLRTSCRDHSYGQRYYACPNSKPGTTERGCGYFMWIDASPGTSSRPSHSPRSAQNLGMAECSNCKFLAERIKTLEARISVLEGQLEMARHPENHTLESAGILHEIYQGMRNLNMECCQEMGQSEQADLTADKIFYACMRCADIVFTKADICQLGMDQRNVGVITREFCDDNKPIILLHHMLPGLLKGQEKMSKSDASSAVFMDDNETEVNLKIKKAFCPPTVGEGNPCLEYIKHIASFSFAKIRVFKTFEEVIADYKEGDLHPADLKPALSKALNRILQPVRDHFKNDEKAKKLLMEVKGFGVTR